ncbi:hypothetical protein ACFYY8_08585 [Streptosporangium sp. NPDC001559]|uniref:hypothetical protein n=1 Tax=Streptosporangium sp. NPDC001559 TaxID=3366187 RepID=UPI0036E2C558
MGLLERRYRRLPLGYPRSYRPEMLAGASTGQYGKRRKMEAMRVDCMRQRGFRYLPYVPSRSRQADKLYSQAMTGEIDGDAQLVKPAGPYGDRLKGKGWAVPWSKPSLMERNGWKRFQTELQKSPEEPSPETAKPGDQGVP